MLQVCHSISDSSVISFIPTTLAGEIKSPTFRTKFDFTGLTDVRICAYVSSSTTSSFTGSMSVQWSRDQVTWNWFTTTPGQPSVMFDSAGAKVSSFYPISGSITGSTSGSDVWIRPVGYNGNGATTVWFNCAVVQAQ
jgi:hypothetical protein